MSKYHRYRGLVVLRQVATVVMKTVRLVLNQFKNFLT